MKYLVLAIAGAMLAGCHSRSASSGTEISPRDLLSDAARAELRLPERNVLTLAVASDIAYVETLDPVVTKTVGDFLKPTGRNFRIVAARQVGKHLLLWVSFPEVADGGLDVIYSVEKRKIVGDFCGGYRG
jgi:hypothetical protein